ncbi:MAG: hypothetical protein JSR71_12485 [Proteobacteria bacterium]|nr:hypothetical protein [Pseudomonadota bacterium]
MHDNIGSQLSYISNHIDWLVEAPGTFSPAEEKKKLADVSDTAKNLITDLRETIWAMNRESVAAEEFADQLKSFLLAQFTIHPKIETTIAEDIQSNFVLSPIEALNIFRICQEAIANAIKHADAEKVGLQIQATTGNNLLIHISDNGKGFIRREHYSGHYGLENMVKRAAETGTTLDIFSAPGKGTIVTISKNGTPVNPKNKI